MAERILIVDDEQSMRDFLSIFLRKQGYEILIASDGQEALDLIMKKEKVDIIISDVRMSNMDGMHLLRKVKQKAPKIEVIVMTAYSSTADAIKAMKDGAYDYITKPFKLHEIKGIITRAVQKKRQNDQGTNSEITSEELNVGGNIIGKSAKIKKVFEMINKVAGTKTNVLISGESGTGKELVAREIHYSGLRSKGPFVTVNCGAIPAELMESELFGHVKGSFTGAVSDKEGLFSVASGGTLFLDEIGELPMQLQVKLLRALQERRFMPVGGTVEITVDARLIAATNRNLLDEVKAGAFREDLYYRLNVIQIRMPALKERKGDIPLLIEHFIKRACEDMGRETMSVSEAALMILNAHDYPGNVRELSNYIERAVALEMTDQVRPDSLPQSILESLINEPQQVENTNKPIDFSMGIDLEKILEDKERDIILQALEHTNGIKTEASKVLGITFRSLRYRLKKLGIDSDNEEDNF